MLTFDDEYESFNIKEIRHMYTNTHTHKANKMKQRKIKMKQNQTKYKTKRNKNNLCTIFMLAKTNKCT